jgi:gluconokinase
MPDLSDQQPVLVLMGVSGCGKSTVAGLLAGQLGWDFQEGDDLHSEENVEKMASGQPLTDDDRWPWLDSVASWIREHDFAGIPGIVTCSALKRSYRDRLRGPHVVFVYLAGSGDEIRNRLSARMNHYMPAVLLDSQLACLDTPAADERVITIGVAAPPAEIAAEIIRRLALRPERFSSALGAPAPGYSSAPPLDDFWKSVDGGQ